MELTVEYSYASAGARSEADRGAGPSTRVREVASMFGLGLDGGHRVAVLPATTVPLPAGGVVFVTGPSGGGKSTLLRCLDGALRSRCPGVRVIDFAGLPAVADRPLVDALGTESLAGALRLLSLAGLNDAFVMLRRPCELSDGQRYRFALARVMAAVERLGDEDLAEGVPCAVVLADEFGAALDRLTAKVVARNVAKWARRSGVCAVLATTHDDLLEALVPEVLVEQGLGGRVVVHRRNSIDEGVA